MKFKSLCDGNDGTKAIKAGDELADGEYARRLAANGLAEPVDNDAKAFCANPKNLERYASSALRQAAKELAAAKTAKK